MRIPALLLLLLQTPVGAERPRDTVFLLRDCGEIYPWRKADGPPAAPYLSSFTTDRP